MSLDINLNDPAVRRLLDADHRVDTTPKRDLVQIAGDRPDPSGLTPFLGQQSTTRLNGDKQEVIVIYEPMGMFMTVDLYALSGEPVRAYLYCPRCHKHLTIRADQKAIDYDPSAENPQRDRILASGVAELVAHAQRGRLSVETFECTWELGDGRHVPGHVHTGASLCRHRMVIDNNLARPA